MKPDEILADPIAVYVAQLSDLDIEGLPASEIFELVQDVVSLRTAAKMPYIPDAPAVVERIAKIRKHLKEAEATAEALPPELDHLVSKLVPKNRRIVDCVRDLQTELERALNSSKKISERLIEAFPPKQRGPNYAGQSVAYVAAKIHYRRTGIFPKKGKSLGVGASSSQYQNFLIVVLPKLGTALGNVKHLGGNAVQKLKDEELNN